MNRSTDHLNSESTCKQAQLPWTEHISELNSVRLEPGGFVHCCHELINSGGSWITEPDSALNCWLLAWGLSTCGQWTLHRTDRCTHTHAVCNKIAEIVWLQDSNARALWTVICRMEPIVLQSWRLTGNRVFILLMQFVQTLVTGQGTIINSRQIWLLSYDFEHRTCLAHQNQSAAPNNMIVFLNPCFLLN
jgi:hypothetical protein